ncbi:dienelactone hydrolase family protein [Oceanobacter sp. 5_MG-2023]|uniref:dienelactone hydrolase family protein n=1 Tax=Oceanobacter sp. 5_MG-2023 TaxID=3062645 RepID=UPI0026E130ED|nr:dienelactone hydrolase family protein [Oceanobacter sp. 5_MG-2023]MDO6683259.1 dienelactone hydrolase family protein [Oceanobacter sp. 5_MG-2023]
MAISITRRLSLAITLLGCLVLYATSVRAAVSSHVITFTTVTMSDQQLLRGKGGEQAGIVGALRLPPGDNNPVVILLYGASGYTYELQDWVELLNQRGIGTFMVDSTNGRIESTSSLRRMALIRDAYAALAQLAKYPGIDPKRIGLIGFTQSGQATLYAGMERMQSLYGQAGLSFAAIAAFYPDCSFQYREDDKLIQAPIRIYHGANDQVNAVDQCRDYVSRSASTGANIQITSYPDAGHAFDLVHSEKIRSGLERSLRDCTIREGIKGILLNQATGRMFRMGDECVQPSGPWVYNPAAASDVRLKLPQFFTQVFDLEEPVPAARVATH